MPKSHNPVFANRPQSIFPTMSALARKHDAINLGQGFPDEDGPQAMLDFAAAAIAKGPNQYAPVEGIAELREAVAFDNKRFYGLDIDPADTNAGDVRRDGSSSGGVFGVPCAGG